MVPMLPSDVRGGPRPRLGVYEHCNATGRPRFHAVFASAPGKEVKGIGSMKRMELRSWMVLGGSSIP